MKRLILQKPIFCRDSCILKIERKCEKIMTKPTNKNKSMIIAKNFIIPKTKGSLKGHDTGEEGAQDSVSEDLEKEDWSWSNPRHRPKNQDLGKGSQRRKRIARLRRQCRRILDEGTPQ